MTSFVVGNTPCYHCGGAGGWYVSRWVDGTAVVIQRIAVTAVITTSGPPAYEYESCPVCEGTGKDTRSNDA